MTTTPELLRDEGMTLAELAADRRVQEAIDAQIRILNATGWEWTADELRKRVPTGHAHLIGARVRAAALRRPVEMVHTGKTVRSTHGPSHCARIAVRRGVGS